MFDINNVFVRTEPTDCFVHSAGSARGVRGRGAQDRFQTSILTWKDDEPVLSEEHDVEGMIWQLEEMEVRKSGMLLYIIGWLISFCSYLLCIHADRNAPTG